MVRRGINTIAAVRAGKMNFEISEREEFSRLLALSKGSELLQHVLKQHKLKMRLFSSELIEPVRVMWMYQSRSDLALA